MRIVTSKPTSEEVPPSMRFLSAIVIAAIFFMLVLPASLHHASLVVIVTSNDGVVLASETMGVSSDGRVEVYDQQKIFPISTKSALVITGVTGLPTSHGTVWLQDAIKTFVEKNRLPLTNASLEEQTRMVSNVVMEFFEKYFLALPESQLPQANAPIAMFVIVGHDMVPGEGGLRLHRFWYARESKLIRLEVQSAPVVKDRSTVVAFGSGRKSFETIFGQTFFGEDTTYDRLRALAVVQRIKKAIPSSSTNVLYVPFSDGPELCRTIIQFAIDHWSDYERGRRTIGGPVKVALITPQRGFQWVN